MIKLTQILFLVFISLTLNAQLVSNVHFEQVGKQIHIYYDLEGGDTYTVQVFCSTDNGQSWGKPLKHVTGAVGENKILGKDKKIVWDVLAEREKLSGNIRFRIEVVNVGIFTDSRDKQTYKSVKIGEQVWMTENLNYKKGNSWCYKNKTTNCNKYGRLYNWKTARTVCPKGWHLPTDNEWKILEMHLGMSQSDADATGYRGTNEGKKLKSISGWYQNTGTNAVGFTTALPGGYRNTGGSFYLLDYYGFWWSATTDGSTSAWRRGLGSNTDKVSRKDYDKDSGFSVRCVRD